MQHRAQAARVHFPFSFFLIPSYNHVKDTLGASLNTIIDINRNEKTKTRKNTLSRIRLPVLHSSLITSCLSWMSVLYGMTSPNERSSFFSELSLQSRTSVGTSSSSVATRNGRSLTSCVATLICFALG